MIPSQFATVLTAYHKSMYNTFGEAVDNSKEFLVGENLDEDKNIIDVFSEDHCIIIKLWGCADKTHSGS